MYKLYLTSIFIISLSVHQIESVNVTLKSSVNDVEGNSFKNGDTIHLTCEFDLDNDKEELTSLIINFGTKPIYNFTLHQIMIGAASHEPGKNEHWFNITNANNTCTGPYICTIKYHKDDDKKSIETKTSEPLTIPFWSGELKSFDFTIHDENDLKKDNHFKRGENLTLSCTANYTGIDVVSIDIQHNTETICTYKEEKGFPVKTDIGEVVYVNNTKLQIKMLSITDKAKGDYLCKMKVKNDQHFYTGIFPKTIQFNAGSTFTISFALIVTSLISTRFSYY